MKWVGSAITVSLSSDQNGFHVIIDQLVCQIGDELS